jgi:hypothetical protein
MTQQLRERIDKWDCMKLKSFCTTKKMVTRLKRQPTECRKSLPAIHSQGIDNHNIQGAQKTKFDSQRINNPVKKWTNELNQAFSKEKVQMGKNHMKKCSTSLAINEMCFTSLLLKWLSSRTQTATNAKMGK